LSPTLVKQDDGSILRAHKGDGDNIALFTFRNSDLVCEIKTLFHY